MPKIQSALPESESRQTSETRIGYDLWLGSSDQRRRFATRPAGLYRPRIRRQRYFVLPRYDYFLITIDPTHIFFFFSCRYIVSRSSFVCPPAPATGCVLSTTVSAYTILRTCFPVLRVGISRAHITTAESYITDRIGADSRLNNTDRKRVLSLLLYGGYHGNDTHENNAAPVRLSWVLCDYVVKSLF